MKKSICSLLLFFFGFIFIKSQDKVSSPLLLQTWKLRKFDTYIYTYEKQDIFDTKSLGMRFKKNGKVIGNLSQSQGYDITENIAHKNLKFERYIGDWKKISDTTLAIIFPSNTELNGTFIISRLTGNELKLKKLFDAKTEKKLDSIRNTKSMLD